MTEQKEVGSFERDTTYRLLVEAVRHWVVSTFLATKKLPEKSLVHWVYSHGPPACLDWGDAPGQTGDGHERPLRGKRITVTLTIEDDVPAKR